MDRSSQYREVSDISREPTTYPSRLSPAYSSQVMTSEYRSDEMYREQLKKLHDMGFTKDSDNRFALEKSNGNVEGAIEHLVTLSSKQEETNREDALLANLRHMGFRNEPVMRDALKQAGGNLNEAINLLVSSSNAADSSTDFFERSSQRESSLGGPAQTRDHHHVPPTDLLDTSVPQVPPVSQAMSYESIVSPSPNLPADATASRPSLSTGASWTVFGVPSKDRDELLQSVPDTDLSSLTSGRKRQSTSSWENSRDLFNPIYTNLSSSRLFSRLHLG